MGIIATIDPADDPDGDATTSVEYRLNGVGAYRPGFPLSRVAATRHIGSLFWLEPGHAYDVRLTFHDPDGGPLDGTVVEATATTRAEIDIPSPVDSYYVDPAGSGTVCTESVPCSLTEGLRHAQPGDEVILRDGIYYQGEITLPRSGRSGAPIVVRGYPGETPIMDGADPATFSWSALGDGIYHTVVNEPNPHLVAADGERLMPYQSLSDLQNLIWSLPGFYADGVSLNVRLSGDADPNSAPMTISCRNHAFLIEQDYVYLVNLTFRHYGQGSWAKAIYLNDASNNLVQACTFAVNDLGIGMKHDSHRNVIQDNRFHDTIFHWPWDAFYAGISLSSGGIRFYSPTTGRGNIIRRNTFHDYFDGFGACPEETSGDTNETDVYQNLVYNAGDDGMETDGECSNVRIWSNTFHDVLMGISLAPTCTGPTYAIRNLIYRTGVGNNSYTGSAFKFNSGYDRSGPMILLHNTADAALPGNSGLSIKEPGAWDIIYARNNVWAGAEYALSNANPNQPLDLDFDDLYSSLPGELAWWAGLPDRHLNTLIELQSATGQETHGHNIEPGFVDAISGDYSLGPTSQLVDAGCALPGINDDFVASAPDIGAMEYRGHGFTLTAMPSVRAMAPGTVATYSVGVHPVGAFTSSVTLMTSMPSLSLTLGLLSTTIAPPGHTTLAVADAHKGAVLPGLWYSFSITGTGGGITQTANASLLVGGSRVYLPLILKHK
jgi:hypothetical protein